MKKLKRILVVILTIFVICLVGYTAHTCSRTTDNLTEQQQEIGGDNFE